MEMEKITTKELQNTLKVALNKISSQDFNIRLETSDHKKGNIFVNSEINVKMLD